MEARLVWKIFSTSAPTSGFCLGLYIGKSKIAFVVTDNNEVGALRIVNQRTVDYASENLLEETLQELQKKYQLENISCRLVLCAHDYQLILINKPQVLESEYRSAALWQIKELLSFPVTDCVIDVFFPAEIVIPHHGKLYVVAAKKSFLTNIVDSLTGLHFSIESIITQEFAIRDAVSLMHEENKILCVLSRSENFYFLTALKNGDILFSRKISANLLAELKDSFEFLQATLEQEYISKLLVVGMLSAERSELQLFLQQYELKTELVDLMQYIKPVIGDQLSLPSSETIYAFGGALQSLTTQDVTNA